MKGGVKYRNRNRQNLIIIYIVSGFTCNKTLWERILGRRCIRHIRINISWEFACTSVQGVDDREY